MSSQFLFKFFSNTIPQPHLRYIAGTDAKSDLKLLLQIATNSRLKQGQDKKIQTKQIFYCRSLGKECFKIQVEFTNDGHYMILDDYRQMTHKNCCEKTGEHPNVIKVYNLMMLKRELIQQYMETEGLNGASPQAILQSLSGGNGEYFYCSLVGDIESRRKLKKRFDNIINITIKKRKQLQDKEQGQSQKTIKAIKTKPISKKKQKTAKSAKLKASPVPKKNTTDYIFKTKQNKQSFEVGDKKERIKVFPKVQSNSSIVFAKDENEVSAEVQVNQFEYPIKQDSIFEEEQEDDYFKKNSEKNIVMNMFNEIGSHNYWPESENSIAQTLNSSDRFRKGDYYACTRNNLLKSLQRKSFLELENHLADGFAILNDPYQ